MVLNSYVSEKKGGWHGDSTEIALVEYALTKKRNKKGTRKKISKNRNFHSIRQENV
jgi:Ca2+-transporting ATPase